MPLSLPHRLIGAWLLGLALATSVHSSVLAGTSSGNEPVMAPPVEEPWSLLVERDPEVEFHSRSAAAALEALSGELDEARRAAALYTLGAAGRRASRERLVGEVTEGSGLERVSAILGLGELHGELGDADLILVDLLEDEDQVTAGCALLALLRTGDPAWRELCEGLGSGQHRLASTARAALAFMDDPGSSPEFAAGRTLLELRWEAGKAFGTIDGRAWSVSLLERLIADEEFLDEVILLSASESQLPGVKDHLLEYLLTVGSDAAVRACVRAMPRELDLLVSSGLWSPDSDRQWRVLVDEALAVGAESRMLAVLEGAMRRRALAATGAAVLLPQEPRFEDRLLLTLEDESERVRMRGAQAIGLTDQMRFIKPLRALEEDEDELVRAAAWISRIALGDSGAVDFVRSQLSGGGSPVERAFLLDAIANGPRAPRMTAFVRDVSNRLTGVDRADLEAILGSWGRVVDGEILRDGFLLAIPGSSSSRRMVKALGSLPSSEDLEFIADLFPVEGDDELNVELALALIRNGHPEVETILQSAVWRGPWNRSILAAAVVKEASGLRALEHWIVRPPSTATSEDIRRVGFAIGEWGGLDAVEALRARMGGVAGADRPALQGALLGALSSRTH